MRCMPGSGLIKTDLQRLGPISVQRGYGRRQSAWLSILQTEYKTPAMGEKVASR